jgi:hypothetical protein
LTWYVYPVDGLMLALLSAVRTWHAGHDIPLFRCRGWALLKSVAAPLPWQEVQPVVWLPHRGVATELSNPPATLLSVPAL